MKDHSEVEEIVNEFLRYLTKEELDLFSVSIRGKVYDLKKQLINRYKGKFLLNSKDEVLSKLELKAIENWSLKSENIHGWKKIIVEELDQFFTDKKPNRFLDWCRENPAIVGSVTSLSIAFVSLLIAIIK